MVENICYFRSSGERREGGREGEGKKRKEKKIYAVENSRVIFFERSGEHEKRRSKVDLNVILLASFLSLFGSSLDSVLLSSAFFS